MRRRLGDLWRGYTDEDRAELERKLAEHADDDPGTIVPLTHGEWRCFVADDYDGGTVAGTMH